MLLACEVAVAKRGPKPSGKAKVTVAVRLDLDLHERLRARVERVGATLPPSLRDKYGLSDAIREVLLVGLNAEGTGSEAAPVEPVKPKAPRRPKT